MPSRNLTSFPSSPASRSLITVFGLLIAVGAGCGEDGGSGPREYITACEEAKPGEPFASDEAYRAFINAQSAKTVMVSEMRGPRVVQDPEGRIISANIPPTFRIVVPKLSSAEPSTGRAPASPALELSQPRPAQTQPTTKGPSLWGRVRNFLSPIGTAHAHCPAFSGENYYLRLYNVRTPEKIAYDAVLSVNEFVPSLPAWRKSMDSRNGQEVEIVVLRATFAGGTITEGPFVAATPSRFAVGP